MLMLRLVIAFCTIVFFIAVCVQVAKKKLLMKYALLWMVLSVIALLVALFPGAVRVVASALGFEVSSNFVFFIVLFLTLAICLSLSVIASKQQEKITSLVQELALLEYRWNQESSEQHERLEQQKWCEQQKWSGQQKWSERQLSQSLPNQREYFERQEQRPHHQELRNHTHTDLSQ